MSAQHSMTLSSLCAGAGIDCPEASGGTLILGVTADTRRVKPGWLFIALNGMRTDARTLIPDAVSRGASAILLSDTGEEDHAPAEPTTLPLVRVKDIRQAMAAVFDAWCGHPGASLCLVGVTGTNGKTSVASMLHHLLSSSGVPCGLIGTVSCLSPSGEDLNGVYASPGADNRSGMTTPDPEELYPMLARMADDAGRMRREDPTLPPPVVVMEVTSHALALSKVSPLSFALGIFTNLSTDHMDFHGTAEAYYQAKKQLFTLCREAVVNGDDPAGRRLLSEGLHIRRWYICRTTAASGGFPPLREDMSVCRCLADGILPHGPDGVEYRLTMPDARLRLSLPVPGSFSIINSMEAAVAASALGLEPRAIRTAMAAFPGVPGRVERVDVGRRAPFSVFIDFAHTPDALEKLLELFLSLRRGEGERQGDPRLRRIVLLFGCGGDRDASKRRLMGLCASRMADFVYVTSDNSRSEDPMAIIRDVLSGIDKERPHAVIPDRREAIRTAIRDARPGDVILLCGKGHETYEINASGRIPFCERDVVRDAVRELYGL